MTADLLPFGLESGPQRKEPEAPETFQRVLDELSGVKAPEDQPS